MKKIAINGFGRIGRMVFRRMVEEDFFDIAAINASYQTDTLAHMIKYDSIHGLFPYDVSFDDRHVIVNGKYIKVVSSRNPEDLPWGELGIDLVIEATGKFTTKEGAGRHLIAGAKKVIITAPSKDDTPMFVYGINESEYISDTDHILSNASCTTNALAPMAKVLDEHFGIVSGLMTTVHSFTNDQKNLDNPHKDLRRARACGQSIIPTSTGAARAIGRVLPSLDGKLNGIALRVPTPNVSLVDLVVDLKKDTSKEAINDAFKHAAQHELKHILNYTDLPLVSADFNTTTHSCIIDGLSTMMIGKNKAKILAWYDNEWGYSCRVVDLAKHVADKIKKAAG